MNAISIPLLAALLLILANCEAQAAGNKSKAAAPSVQKKESTPKDGLLSLQNAAAQGVAEAQYNLGWIYSKGEGVPKDTTKSFEWFQKAAAQGHTQAQFFLGVMYAKGEGISKDSAKAIEWFQKAAAQGHAEAQFFLGVIYTYGEGVTKDPKEAAKLNILSAKATK